MLSVLWSKKTRAILAFLKEVNRALSKEYSEKDFYTKEQVAWVVSTSLPQHIKYIEYALFMYMKPEDFDYMNNLLGGIYLTEDIRIDILHVVREIKDKSAFAKYSSVSGANSMRL